MNYYERRAARNAQDIDSLIRVVRGVFEPPRVSIPVIVVVVALLTICA